LIDPQVTVHDVRNTSIPRPPIDWWQPWDSSKDPLKYVKQEFDRALQRFHLLNRKQLKTESTRLLQITSLDNTTATTLRFMWYAVFASLLQTLGVVTPFSTLYLKWNTNHSTYIPEELWRSDLYKLQSLFDQLSYAQLMSVLVPPELDWPQKHVPVLFEYISYVRVVTAEGLLDWMQTRNKPK
jgi:hypothetical protein